jgi:pimeloyl-ACP methyl ester carboxylesterase
MQDLVVHYRRLLDILELQTPHLVGHSMGGWMAAELAAVAGERFERLVLNAPAGLNHPDYPSTDLSKVAPHEMPLYMAHRVEVAARYFPGGSLAPPADEFVRIRQQESVALTNIRKTHGMGHPNLGRWLSRIPNETLIVWGDKDRVAMPGQAPIWATSIERATTCIIPNAGHFAMQEDPRTVTAIADFLANGISTR